MRTGIRRGKTGFTLVEVLISTALLGLVVGGAWSIFVVFNRMWNNGAAQMRAAVKMDRAVNYILFGGPGQSWTGVRDISATSATLTVSAGGWVFNSGTNQLSYSTTTKKITDAQGIAITDDLLLSTAALTNNGLRVVVTIVQNSTPYTATNSFVMFASMRNK